MGSRCSPVDYPCRTEQANHGQLSIQRMIEAASAPGVAHGGRPGAPRAGARPARSAGSTALAAECTNQGRRPLSATLWRRARVDGAQTDPGLRSRGRRPGDRGAMFDSICGEGAAALHSRSCPQHPPAANIIYIAHNHEVTVAGASPTRRGAGVLSHRAKRSVRQLKREGISASTEILGLARAVNVVVIEARR